jgi:hypothetical protein
MQFPEAFEDELELLCEKLPFDREIFASNTPYFVRSDNVSLKCGQHGVGPYTTFKQIIESLVTCSFSHTPIHSNTEQIALYLIPWCPNLIPAREYRVFVCCDRITAISQQHLYTVYEPCDRIRDAGIITSYYDAVIKEKLAHISSYVMDIAVLEDDTAYFIEVNPFGAEYSSGSSLFGWVEDRDILYGVHRGDRDGTIYVRYTSR